MRIEKHPIINFPKKEKVFFFFDGKKIHGHEGDTVASALHDNGIMVYRVTENSRKRGFFCAIGKCSSCFMRVDGVPNVKTCITPLKKGMKVETQTGKGEYK